MDWTGLFETGLGCACLHWIGLGWTGVDSTGSAWLGLDWIGLDPTGVDQIGPDWTGEQDRGWPGLKWSGLDYRTGGGGNVRKQRCSTKYAFYFTQQPRTRTLRHASERAMHLTSWSTSLPPCVATAA